MPEAYGSALLARSRTEIWNRHTLLGTLLAAIAIVRERRSPLLNMPN